MKRFSFQPAVDSLEGRVSLSRLGGHHGTGQHDLQLADRSVHHNHHTGADLNLNLNHGTADLQGFGAHHGR